MCNKCKNTGYVIEREDDLDEICPCAAGQALCGGVIIDDRQDQGNDSLGLGKPDPAVVGGKNLPFDD